MDRKSCEMRTLQRQWYRKLEAEGFENIEYEGGELKALPAPGHLRSDSLTPEDYDAHAEYYQRAAVFLRHHRFAADLDRDIWRLHSEGGTFRDIAQQLGTYTRKVNDTVQRLRSIMLNGAGTKGKKGTKAQLAAMCKRLEHMDIRLLLQIAPLFLGSSHE